MSRQAIKKLLKYAELPNLLDLVKDADKIGRDVVRYAKVDDQSRADWLKRSEHAMKLALQTVEQKTTPWPGASNVKYPLITSAALQFHARAYASIIQGNTVVKGQVTGADPDGMKMAKAKRISDHMNWQLLEENPDWESEADSMLLALSIEGCEFKKSYFSKERGYNVSEWVRPEDLIVHNRSKSLATTPRITHRLWYYPYQIDMKVRSGIWADAELGLSSDEYEEEKEQEFYEQHTFLDLDGDGLKEPYIVTVHVRSEKPVRIVAGYEIEDIIVSAMGTEGKLVELAQELLKKGIPGEVSDQVLDGVKLVRVPRGEMFTKFGFIPSPDGSFYDIGFGQLIGPLSDSVDTNINQLIDAGTLANQQGGFIHDGVQVDGKRGVIQWKRGEFVRVKVSAQRTLQESIYQMKFPEPSMVLFQLLGTLIQAAREVSSVHEIMTGAAAPNEEKATTSMIRIEQGMKVFSAIYKRIYRSLKQEFRKLYKLNGRYLQPTQYYKILDTQEQGQVELTDYVDDGTDVQPVADPQLATSLLAFAKNQQLLGIMNHPLINDEDILKRFLEGLEIPHPETAIVPPDQRQPPPDPEMVLKAQIAASEHSARVMSMFKDLAAAMKNVAEAESIEAGQQAQEYVELLKQAIQGIGNGQQLLSMATPSGNGAMAGSPGGGPAGIPQAGGGVPGPGMS